VEGKVEPGTEVVGRILDVSKKDGIVDLTLKAGLVAAAPKSAGASGAKPSKSKSKSKSAELDVRASIVPVSDPQL